MTFESNPTCPYCGHEVDSSDRDLWEYEGEDNDFECPNCEKELVLNVQVTTEYELKRPECQDGEHEYGEWVRMDIDQKTLDRRGETPIMEEFSKGDPHSYYCRDCNNCDDTDYSENMPLGTELVQNYSLMELDDD